MRILIVLIALFATPVYGAERPAKWCGWWLANHLGMHDKALWKASNWATVGRRVPYPVVGAVAVYPHHVGIITGVPAPGQIKMLSGNDGHKVRDRIRPTAGVIAYVVP